MVRGRLHGGPGMHRRRCSWVDGQCIAGSNAVSHSCALASLPQLLTEVEFLYNVVFTCNGRTSAECSPSYGIFLTSVRKGQPVPGGKTGELADKVRTCAVHGTWCTWGRAWCAWQAGSARGQHRHGSFQPRSSG